MEEKYTEGQEVTKDIYTDVAIWCNAGGKYHIEEQDGKYVIVQTAPAVRAAIGEEFGEPIGTNSTGKMVAALHRLGFYRVFDNQNTQCRHH